MPANKSSFLDKVLGRIGRLDRQGLQTVVQRLARERHFLETLFNTIQDGILVLDEAGRVLYFNDAVTRLLGLQRASAEGQPISRFLPELDWEKLAAFNPDGGTRVTRHELEVPFPRPRFLSLYAAPLDEQAAGSSGLALIIHDVTEVREQTFAAIESERIQALTLLAASVAHEIGNPLNALHIHLQLMDRELRKLKSAAHDVPERPGSRQPRGDPRTFMDSALKFERYLEVARGEVVRLDYILTQFLQAIRPSPPRFAPTQINDVVRETLELLRPEIDNRGVVVQEKLARHAPLLPADAGQIKQVLVNLMKNALQAMTRGGILTVQTEPASDGLWLSVSDTGGGISPDQVKRIFEPFYTTKKKGSGLGLMIVQRIVRDHGGRIELESKLQQGTSFRIWLPSQERRPRLLEAGGAPPEGARPATAERANPAPEGAAQ